jgi:hypothetical protein
LQHTFVPFFFALADFDGMADFTCLHFPMGRNLSIQVFFLFEFFDWTSFFFSVAALSKSSLWFTFGKIFTCSFVGFSFIAQPDTFSLSSTCVQRQSTALSSSKQHSGEVAVLYA